jgi:oligosaccharide 4-alpha-D-glucosyltransferase
VEFIPIGSENPPSYAVTTPAPEVKTRLREYPDSIVYSTTNMAAIIHKEPFRIRYRYRGSELVSEESGYFDHTGHRGFRFELDPEEKITGAGSRVLGMDRRGHRLTLYNQPSYGYETEAELMYYSLPVVVSSEKYMLVFDNGARGYADLGATEPDILEFGATGGRMSYIVVAAESWPELAVHFTEITGRQPMLPRWALGNIASRMGYHSQREAEYVVDRYLEEDIPLDGIVFDLFWFGPDIKGHVGNLEWYRDSFPDPEKMMQDFREKGVKTVLITEPFVLENTLKYNEVIEKGLVGKTVEGEPYHYDFYFGHTTLLDIFNPETQKWFWDIYKRHTLSGVAGWWGDLGEPEVHPDDMVHVNGLGEHVHNLYGHEWAGTLFRGYAQDFPEERPVILMRSGFVGSQRYGIVPWTGDVNRTWGGLKPQVELSLTMGLQGIGLMHSDLGGFAGSYKDPELYIRWLQYGVFQPVYRTHAQESVPAEPIFWDQATRDVVREFIKLRYRLLPYNYSLLYHHSQTGIPMMRPLFYIEDRPDLFDTRDAYLWGDAFLVEPVVEPGIRQQEIYLPANQYWFDFWSDRVYRGGKTIKYRLTPEIIPVFVRAGSFVPMVEAVQHTEHYTSDTLDVHYYHHASVTQTDYTFYHDDGKTAHAMEKGKYEKIVFNAMGEKQKLSLQIQPKTNKERKINFLVHGMDGFKGEVRMENQKLSHDLVDGVLHFGFELGKNPVGIELTW